MCQCYGKIYCFHLRCRRRKQRVPLNHSCLFINPRCVTAKKVIQLFIFTLKTKSRFFQNVGICLPRCMTSCPRLEWSTVSDISIDNAATSVGTWTVQDSIQGQEAWKRLKYVTMRNMTEGESRIKQEDWKHKKKIEICEPKWRQEWSHSARHEGHTREWMQNSMFSTPQQVLHGGKLSPSSPGRFNSLSFSLFIYKVKPA